MLRMIELRMVLSDQTTFHSPVESTGVDEDGLPVEGNVINLQTAPATECPVMVAVDQIRCFYPRKGGRTGTRLTFHNSSGMPVRESYEEVKALIRQLIA